MTKVVAVPGTLGRWGGWWQPGSPFWSYQAANGLIPAQLPTGHVFEWDSELDWLSWFYGGRSLLYFLLATMVDRVIAHSFGGYVALHAAAEGARIERLITIGTPVREDMRALRERARPNIGRWWQVIDPNFDLTAVLGAIDGSCGPITREMPEADATVGVNAIGHGGELLDARDPAQAVKWERQSLAAFLRGEGYESAA